ncbi:hypothetical protein AB6809_29815 [Paraburkholderia sp. RCC_158]|uniref:hypothetical protein n=1 Tax=Paraburkholderia sp. RCC_158 TaxID=3239220 RepID=UPI00352609F8
MTTQSLMDLLAKRKAATGGQKTIKPKTGRNRYRILPGWRKNGDPTFYHDFGQHFIKDAAGAVKAVYVCVDKTFGRPCEVCDAVAQGIQMSTDDLTKKRVEDAKASGRVLLVVLELDGTQPTVPQILEVAPTVFNGNKGVGGIINLFDEWPNMLDPVNGNDIIIEKSGAGMDTRYAVQIAGASKPVPPDALTKICDLDAYVQQENDQAHQRALLSVRSVAGLPPPAATPALGYAPATAGGVYAAQPAPQPWEVDETLAIGDPAMAAAIAAAQPAAAVAVVQPTAVAPAAVAAVATQPVAVAAAATPAPAVAVAQPVAQPAAAAGASTGDPELDALLAGL